ncbi:hypothetical protein DWV07_07145 [Dickeya zeae]|nr:hypothetical protein DWV07_07145 [Dickeya zeae]
MGLDMRQIDNFIETAINRLSSEAGTMSSNFYVDLRDASRQRITQSYVNQCIDLCNSRGISAERSGDGLLIHVDLQSCYLNANQSMLFNTAINYTRSMHGNYL